MKHNLPLYQLILAILIANFPFLTAYPQGEWKWAHSWTGSGGSYTQIFNQITNTAFDEDGNIYVYGSMGGNPEMDGQHFLTDVPSEVSNGAIPTILLAKFDTLGNMLWYKIVKCSNDGGHISSPQWMEVRNRRVYISGITGLWGDFPTGTWLYYMDTLIRKGQVDSMPESERRPPFKRSRWTFFAQFDLDGNLLEDHFVESYTRDKILNGTTYIRPVRPVGQEGTMPMHVDDGGNVYLFARFYYAGNEEDPFTIVVDGDSNKTYDLYLPGNISNPNRVFCNAMFYKFTPDWELEFAKLVVQQTDGIAASWEFLADSVNPHYDIRPEGMSYDEDGNMYLSGYILIYMFDYETGGHLHHYPIHIWWDSTHCATIQDMSGAYRTNFIIKYDTNGRVRWCNQIYTKGNSIGSPFASVIWHGNCLEGEHVYLCGSGAYTPESSANIYFDSEENSLQRYVPYSSAIGFFVKYNKNTGHYVSQGIVPALEVAESNMPSCKNNRVFAAYSYDNTFNCLLTKWYDNGILIGEDTIYSMNSRMDRSYGVTANSDGSLLLSLTSFSPVTFSDNVVANSNPGSDNAVFALYRNLEYAEPYVGITGYGERASDLKLWPNPANGIIHVEGGRSPMDYITVSDLTGRMLLRRNVGASSATIDVSRLPAGTYILEVVGGGDVRTEKFVKTNIH